MSKLKRRAKKATFKDVTINDFANSPICNDRAKKSTTNVTSVIKEEAAVSWDDKVGDEFDYVEEVDEEGVVTLVLKKIQLHEETAITKQLPTGNDYPVDLWYMISDYIRPDDVSTFACICKTSYAVTNTAKFWFSLYRRFYQSKVNYLPDKLKPGYIFRVYGVRASVIRALFHMYSPFKGRVVSMGPLAHPDAVNKRQCVLMWHNKFKDKWVYYFKLKELPPTPKMVRNCSKPLNLMERLEDVCANEEESCRILKVVCTNFIAVPSVQGLYLTSTSMTLSHGLLNHRIQLVFDTTVGYARKPMDSNCLSILLDPVVNVNIMDWWHPMYPYRNSMVPLFHHLKEEG